MKIYISGITGTGMGPLALMAANAGMEVYGSDLAMGAVYDELVAAGVKVRIGTQDGEYLRECLPGLDWYVHTSALPADYPELMLAREAGVRVTKRDDLTAYLVEQLGLKMVAVAGTHGKTTTVSMIVWASLQLGLPVAYIVGTTLGFAPSGAYAEGAKYFVYEADEYDRNFLKYWPWLAVIPYVSYDHPDIYPTREDYEAAFERFRGQSEGVVEMKADGMHWNWSGEAVTSGRISMDVAMPAVICAEEDFSLAGAARRMDARLAAMAVAMMAADCNLEVTKEEIVAILNKYPGASRRFERLAEGIYTDYAHHPEEIVATVEMAGEQAKIEGRRGVVVVYQPHQNTRQHEVRAGYAEAFAGATRVIWLPTYLTREDPSLAVLAAEELSSTVTGVQSVMTWGEPDEALYDEIVRLRDDGYLVVLMTAGPADGWLRGKVADK